jgi:FkbM family methyltransferase
MAAADPFGAHAPNGFQRGIMRITASMPRNWIGRRLAFGLRRLGMIGVDQAVDAEVFGQRMRLHPSHKNVSAKRLLFTPQYFDHEERTLLARKAAETQGEFVFLDIGANVGGYSLFVAGAVGERARVLAFEPQPDVREELLYSVAQNPKSRIKVFACALADRDGEMELHVSDTNQGETSLRPVKHAGGGAIAVPVRTLLGVLREEGITHIGALKIDVEGAEDLVLAPFLAEAEDALLPGMVVIEDSHKRWRADCIALLKGRGYRVAHRSKRNLILERP